MLTKAQSAIEEEARLRQSTQRDLVFIACEFEMFYYFLNVATAGRVENKVVMTWVRKVRELAYDVEECIDFIVHLDTKTSWCWRIVPSFMAGAAIPLDQAADEIKQIKASVEELSTMNKRYNLFSDSGSNTVTQHQPTASNTLTVTGARDAARRLQGLGDLTHLITNKDNRDPHLQVISVWGTGSDLGMTSIIRKVYKDPEIGQNFDCRSWVKLMHPFNPREFVRRFMAQVYANGCREEGADVGVYVLGKMEADQQDLLKEFVKEVNTKTYLVILENLTDMVDWDAVRTFLPDMKKGSWIIVSTQQFEIASLCIGHSYQATELKQFSADHSIFAFFKQGSRDNGDKDEKRALSHVGQNSSANRETAMYWMEKNPLVGREKEMNELRSYTAKARFSYFRVVSVRGIAGIGKSALVRNLYYDRMLHSQQFNEYRWVDISHPFNLQDFYRRLLLDHQFEKDPIKECHKLLSQRQCLVIIDDLRSKEEWDSIKGALVSESSASIIIVITTEANIATYCTNNEEQVFNVKGLEPAASMDLFTKEVHRKEPLSALNALVHLDVDELILKCGGFPNVIVALAAILAIKTVTLMDSVRSLNQRFMHHLETNPEYYSLWGQLSWMQAYFWDCPDSLKPCIFYLSFFPRDCNIRRRRLVRRWIAEGYSSDNNEKSAEEQGEEFFLKLLDLNIIQKIHRLGTTALIETRMGSCQVNDLIREYIVSRRMEENLVFELGPNCDLTTQRTGRHLVILNTWDRDRIMFESIDLSRLRSLTVFGKWQSFFISKSMRLLWVLDLEDALGVKDEDLEKMVEQLHRLKFLSLRGCREICHLPSSIRDLKQLQTLDVRHTSIVTLPASITKLQKLQYIRAGTKVPTSTPSASSSRLPEFRRRNSLVGVKVPRGIGKLTALHTLGVVNVGASGGKAIVEELMKLTQLRKLGVSGINMHNSKEFFHGTSGLVHLDSLLVELDKNSQSCLDDIYSSWENLQSLTLYGLRDMLPLRNRLSKLSKLDLEMDTLQKDGMEFLAKQPELCILHLRVKQLQPEDGKLHFHAQMNGEELDTFKKVKILEITCSSSRLHVIFGSKSMKKLELLKIDCSSAYYQLSGLDDLSGLKEVLLKGTNDETIKTAFERQLVSHPKKPTVKLAALPASS
uniref:Uncharacterized protein n=1 Tax=Avena sativa TaxID=4498 RepID=A0ACD5UIG7_AVESA